MMAERPGFMIYFDTAPAFERLDDADAGRLIKALLSYSSMGELLPLRLTSSAPSSTGTRKSTWRKSKSANTPVTARLAVTAARNRWTWTAGLRGKTSKCMQVHALACQL